MADSSNGVIESVRVRPVRVPLPEPITTASGRIENAPMVLFDVTRGDGATGSAYVFTYAEDALGATAEVGARIADAVAGHDAEPEAVEAMLQGRYRLMGVQGLVGMAMAGLDMALWDLQARAAGVPLAVLLGGTTDPIPAYLSLGMLDERAAAERAEQAAADGYRALKIKIGWPDAATDLAVIRAARTAGGDGLELMVDLNQSLSAGDALERCRAFEGEGLAWIEEPTLAGDFAGHAAITQATDTPIQLGENWWGVADMENCLSAGAGDLAMVDVMRIGGVTGWLRSAALAEAHGKPLSSHAFPEVSGHLLAVTPTRHWLELLDKASTILQEPVRIENGDFIFSEAPGAGMVWDEAAVARFAA